MGFDFRFTCDKHPGETCAEGCRYIVLVASDFRNIVHTDHLPSYILSLVKLNTHKYLHLSFFSLDY